MVILFTGETQCLPEPFRMSSTLASKIKCLSLFSREDDGIVHFVKLNQLYYATQRQSSSLVIRADGPRQL